VSNLLHADVEEGTVVHVSAPMGDFTLARNKTTPVVLMSGGVGVTPMTSMLSTILADGSERSVTFVHACRNGRVHAFRQWLNETVASHSNVKRVVFYEAVGEGDRRGVDYDFDGRLDVARIAEQVVVPDADYYICGPVPFMRAQCDALAALGVDPAGIHTEVFGSGVVE
jgi:nitric oxide dioxygenase